VKSRPTALVAGDPPGDSTYTLDQLPPGAPSLGTYNGTLTIILSAIEQAAVAGQYAIQASATGYATQTPSPLSVNVAGGDQPNQNLALTP
jgi:hypothetical protein